VYLYGEENGMRKCKGEESYERLSKGRKIKSESSMQKN
jgi:hypothetical protein